MQPINIWSDATATRFSLSHFGLHSPIKFKHIIFSKDRLPYNPEDVTDFSLLPKRLKIIDVPIHLIICHSSIWTKHKSTFGNKNVDFIYMQDQYLSATSNVNLSPAQWHNIKILLKCDINKSGHKLGSLRWEIGASLIRCRINKSSKPIWTINKLTFTKIYR